MIAGVGGTEHGGGPTHAEQGHIRPVDKKNPTKTGGRSFLTTGRGLKRVLTTSHSQLS